MTRIEAVTAGLLLLLTHRAMAQTRPFLPPPSAPMWERLSFGMTPQEVHAVGPTMKEANAFADSYLTMSAPATLNGLTFTGTAIFEGPPLRFFSAEFLRAERKDSADACRIAGQAVTTWLTTRFGDPSRLAEGNEWPSENGFLVSHYLTRSWEFRNGQVDFRVTAGPASGGRVPCQFAAKWSVGLAFPDTFTEPAAGR